MKNILVSTFICMFSYLSVGQITANGNSGASTTAYTNGASNDPIFIWCAEGLSNNTASLTATPPSGTGPFTFDWFYHNQTNSSWTSYTTTNGSTSTINNLVSDGYKVQIYDNLGALVACYNAWVWNMNSEINVGQTATACDATNLNGTINFNGSFTYYNPPPPESIITPSTSINVCFTANHTFVSDLAFYLKGPPSCGSPTILLSPNPGANGQGSVCNGGDNISNLCFSTSSTNNLNVCTASAPLTGTYGSYGASPTFINWSALYGCNAAQGGWAVQIYDCIGADVGALTNATINFANLGTECGSLSTINYYSGAINSTINDNSCSAATASIFQVPVSPVLTTPIVINASSSYSWTSSPVATIPNSTTSLTPSVTGLAGGSTMFYLTGTFSYGSANCTNIDSVEFISNCCSVTADAGSDVTFCSGSNSQIGTPSLPGLTYSWSPSAGLSNPTIAQPTVTGTILGSGSQVTTYTITVTNVADGGCTDVNSVDVTINPTPAVDAGNYSPVCQDAASFSLIGTPAGGTFTGTGVTGNNFSPSQGSQTITYTYTGANGCSNSESELITIYNLPIVNGGSDITICAGQSVTLTGSGATTYVWDNAGSNGQSVTPLVTTTYNVVGTTLGCQDNDDVTITVNPLTVPTFNPTANLCQGTIAPTPPSSSLNDIPGTWSPATINTSTAGTTNYTFTPNDILCNTVVQVAVTIDPLPVVDAGTDASVCIDAASIPLVGSPAGGVFSGTGVTGTNFAPSSGTQTISYTYTDANGCTNTDNQQITINNLPTVNAGSDIVICDGESVTLSGSGASTYTWDNGVLNNQAFTPSEGQIDYTVTGTDANGCVNTDVVTVSVANMPNADAIPDVTSGYPGLTVNFLNNSTVTPNYYWNFGDGGTGITTNVATTPTNSYDQPGTYTMVLEATNGTCSDFDTVQIIVLEYPEPTIEVPNVFTPNNDGSNDFFLINTENTKSIQYIIVNRWGNLIFEDEGVNPLWNGNTASGKSVEEGVYFVKYVVIGLNDQTYTGQGSLTLMRD